MKFSLLKKVFSFFIILSMVFVAIGCDFTKFGLNFGNEEESGETEKPNGDTPDVVIPNEEDATIENLLKYFYDRQSMPYSFTTWLNKFENSGIKIIRDVNNFYFSDATNNRYLYFTFDELNNNPLNIEILDTSNSIFIKVNNRWIQLFAYEVVTSPTKYNVFFYDGFGSLLGFGEVNSGDTVLSALSRFGVSYSPIRNGFNFLGWNINNRIYSPADLASFVISYDLTVIAAWESNSSVGNMTVEIRDHNDNAITYGEFPFGTTAETILNTLMSPNDIARITNIDGYDFVGWYVGEYGGIYSTEDLANLPISCETKLVVVLKDNNTIWVQAWDRDGTGIFNEGSAPYGSSIADALLSIGLNWTPGFGEYIITGWYVDVTGEVVGIDNLNDYYLYSDTKLYIQYESGEGAYVVISDFPNSVREFWIPVGTHLSDALKQNGYDVRLYRDNYDFVSWDYSDNWNAFEIREEDTYSFTIERNCFITARWNYIGPECEEVELTGTNVFGELDYIQVLENNVGKLCVKKTRQAGDWSYIAFQYPEGFGEHYNRLVSVFKGPTNAQICFKINDTLETWFTCTGDYQEITIDFELIFDKTRFSLLIFPDGGKSGTATEFEFSSIVFTTRINAPTEINEYVFYGGTDPRFTKRTEKGFSIDEQDAIVGIGKKSIHIGDKLFVLPRYSLISLGEFSSTNLSYVFKDDLQIYGTDGTTQFSTGLIYDKATDTVSPINSYGHGALYYNAGSHEIYIDDVANTYGRNLYNDYFGYNRYIFRHVSGDLYRAELINCSLGNYTGLSIVLHPYDYLWCPMTAERYCTGLTDCSGNGVIGSLYDGVYLEVLDTQLFDFPSGGPTEGVVDEIRLGEYNDILGLTIETLSDAMNYINENGTIYLGNSVYVGNVNVNKSVTIIGVDEGIRDLSQRTNGSVVDGLLAINANNVIINGLTFEGTNSYIEIPMGDNITINYCKFGNQVNANSNILISNASNISVEYCWFIDDIYTMSKRLIMASTVTNLFVNHNHIYVYNQEQPGSNEFVRIVSLYGQFIFTDNICDAFATNLWYIDIRNGIDAIVKITNNSICGREGFSDEPGIALYNFNESSIIEIENNVFRRVNGNTFRFDGPNFVIPIQIKGNYYDESTHFKIRCTIDDNYIRFQNNTYMCEPFGDVNGTLPSDYNLDPTTIYPVIDVPYEAMILFYPTFIAGESLERVFNKFLSLISITDRLDGTIQPTMDMIDLGDFDIRDPQPGYFNFSISYTNSSGNTTSYGFENNYVAEAKPFTVDFADATVGAAYNSTSWIQERQEGEVWHALSNQMNCREKDGTRVINMTSGYGYRYRYNYNEFGQPLGGINKVTLQLGNYFSGIEIPVRIIVIDSLGRYHYLFGDDGGYFSFPVTTGLETFEFDIDYCDVQMITFEFLSDAQQSVYFYVGPMEFGYREADYSKKIANTTIGFEDGIVGTSYENPMWTQEKYVNGEWQKVTGQMNCRQKDNDIITNMVCGYGILYRYTYNFSEDQIGYANDISFRFGNYFTNAEDIYVKIYAITTDGRIRYFYGGEDSFQTFPAGYEYQGWGHSTEPIEIKTFVFIVKSDMYGSAYFYVGPIRLAYEDIYVSQSFSGRKYGEYIEPNSEFSQSVMVYGVNAFSTITDAINNATDGKKIWVGAGTYNEELYINKSVHLYGANRWIPGYSESRRAESIITGMINVASSFVTINGFTLTNQTRFVDNNYFFGFEYINNILDGFTGDGYINSYLNANYSPELADLRIDGNYVPNTQSMRVFQLATVHNLYFNNNKFIRNEFAQLYDYMCIHNCLYGYAEMNNNYFDGNDQGVFRILGVGELTFNIKDNYFKNILATCIDTRNMVDEHRGDVQINIIHNTFDHAGYNWCCIRPRTANYNENSLDVQVHYNTFINGCNSVELTDNYRYAENPTGDRQIYNMDNNYFEEVKAADLSNVNFGDAAYSWANCYDSVEDLERDYQLVKDNYNY